MRAIAAKPKPPRRKTDRVSQGVDIERLTELFVARYGLVLEAAVRYAPGASLARDIAQQSFLVFVRGVREKGWTLDGNLDALLYGIAKNVARKMWAKECRNGTEALEMIAERFFAANRFRDENMPEEIENREQARLRLQNLKNCMEKLDEKGRYLLDEHYCRGTPIEELGRRDGVKPNTMRQVFCRLRAKLRDCIEKNVRKQIKPD